MKFRILRYSAMTRREIFKSIAKWVLFSLVLLVSYTIEVTMPFASWQPYLTLTTAVAVSFWLSKMDIFSIMSMRKRGQARGLSGFSTKS